MKSFHTQLLYLIFLALFTTYLTAPSQLLAQGHYTNSVVGYRLEYDGTRYGISLGMDETSFSLYEYPALGNIQVELVRIPERIFAYDSIPSGTSRDTIIAFALQRAMGSCASGGVDGDTYCKDPSGMSTFKSKNGLDVFKFYLTFEEKADTIIDKTVGPFFCVDISSRGITKGLLFCFKFGQLASQSEEIMLRRLIDSITLL
jgi:hypothetical protein